MVYRRCAFVILVVAGISTSAMAETEFSGALELGYRGDRLDWNIAGDSSGQNPNVLSELSWSNMAIHQLRAKLDAHRDRVHLFGSVGYGKVRSGHNQDSDYAYDNRQGVFSRSNNRAGGDVADASVGAGYRLAVAANRYVMPMAGVSLHRQNLTMSDGRQAVPPLGTFHGLDSSYDAQWQDGWLGVSFIDEDVGSGVRLAFDVAYHRGRYQAEADWNLRSDFAHPVSFEHRANGEGLAFSLNSVTRLTTNMDWLFSLDYSAWHTGYGVDTIHAIDEYGVPFDAQTRLNEVKWQSMAINFGLAQRF